MMATNTHFKKTQSIGIDPVYFSMIAITLSGKYLPITTATSFNPILFLIKANIRKNISTIAIKNTKDENLLKNINTSIIPMINVIKSIYISNSPILTLLNFIIKKIKKEEIILLP